MIRFHDLPANEEAVDQVVREMREAGYKATEARPIAEQAAALVLATMRGLDAKIDAMTDNEVDRSVIQQIVMLQIHGITRETMRLNAVQGLMAIILGGKR